MSKKKYLVVEDSHAMRRVIINTLSRIIDGVFLEAENGIEAVDQFKVEKFDFILMDWLMPMMDGLEAAGQIRQLPGGQDVSIIMITTKSTKSDIIQAISSGIDDYIVKPVNTTILEQKIKKLELKKSTVV